MTIINNDADDVTDRRDMFGRVIPEDQCREIHGIPTSPSVVPCLWDAIPRDGRDVTSVKSFLIKV